jgi:hypothetical protein
MKNNKTYQSLMQQFLAGQGLIQVDDLYYLMSLAHLDEVMAAKTGLPSGKFKNDGKLTKQRLGFLDGFDKLFTQESEVFNASHDFLFDTFEPPQMNYDESLALLKNVVKYECALGCDVLNALRVVGCDLRRKMGIKGDPLIYSRELTSEYGKCSNDGLFQGGTKNPSIIMLPMFPDLHHFLKTSIESGSVDWNSFPLNKKDATALLFILAHELKHSQIREAREKNLAFVPEGIYGEGIGEDDLDLIAKEEQFRNSDEYTSNQKDYYLRSKEEFACNLFAGNVIEELGMPRQKVRMCKARHVGSFNAIMEKGFPDYEFAPSQRILEIRKSNAEWIATSGTRRHVIEVLKREAMSMGRQMDESILKLQTLTNEELLTIFGKSPTFTASRILPKNKEEN